MIVTYILYITLSFIFVKFTLVTDPIAVASNDCAKDCLHKDCCAQAFGRNTLSKPHTGLLHSLPIPDRPWQSIGLDFIGPLPKLNNFDYLLVIIDQLTSQVHLVTTMATVTARGIVWLILKEVMRLHEIPA